MPEPTEEVIVPEKDEVVVPPVEKEEEPKSEEETPQVDEDGFVKGNESVSAGKHNQAIRKLREAELEKRTLEKELEKARKGVKPAKEEEPAEDEDDFFEEEEEKPAKKKSLDIESLVDAKVKPVLERLNQKEAEERKNHRTAFFKAHPQYLTDSEKWQELLDEMDNSLNPNSKDSYYKQLIKAHRIVSAEEDTSVIDKKKQEMASESASKGDGSQKAADRKSSVDERADRLAKKMPIGFTFTGK
jgi:hypothetical protein